MYTYHCVIRRIVDGDTIDIDIDLGFEVWLFNQRVRLDGVDAPEIRTRDLAEKEAGFKSMEFVESVLPVGTRTKLHSNEYHGERGKFGRIIGDFEIYDPTIDSWTTLCTSLLRQNLAEKYPS